MYKLVKRAVVALLLAIAALAVYDQLSRSPEHRTWVGEVFGVPYDFRIPTIERLQARVWNPDDPRILTPHVWGVGWSINLYHIVNR